MASELEGMLLSRLSISQVRRDWRIRRGFVRWVIGMAYAVWGPLWAQRDRLSTENNKKIKK